MHLQVNEDDVAAEQVFPLVRGAQVLQQRTRRLVDLGSIEPVFKLARSRFVRHDVQSKIAFQNSRSSSSEQVFGERGGSQRLNAAE